MATLPCYSNIYNSHFDNVVLISIYVTLKIRSCRVRTKTTPETNVRCNNLEKVGIPKFRSFCDLKGVRSIFIGALPCKRLVHNPSF